MKLNVSTSKLVEYSNSVAHTTEKKHLITPPVPDGWTLESELRYTPDAVLSRFRHVEHPFLLSFKYGHEVEPQIFQNSGGTVEYMGQHIPHLCWTVIRIGSVKSD